MIRILLLCLAVGLVAACDGGADEAARDGALVRFDTAAGFRLGMLVPEAVEAAAARGDTLRCGRELDRYAFRNATVVQAGDRRGPADDRGDGSIIIVIATDAPLDHRQLRRLAERSMSGLACTGSSMSNGSGDYAIAFSTAAENRVRANENLRTVKVLGNDAMSPLFQAVIETTEEAIYNSLFKATTVTGKDKRTVEALPLEQTISILKKYGKLK